VFLTEKHDLIRKLARDFAEKEFTSDVLDKAEETGEFPKELVVKMAKAGFYGVKAPTEIGGGGGDHLAYAIVVEEIARGSGVASVWVSGPNSLAGTPFIIDGTDEQKEKYLRPMLEGTGYVCFGLTEPGAGSDAGGMVTSAVPDGDYYVLNGRKTFITAAPVSTHAVIFAKTNPSKGTRGITSFIVDMKLPGVSLGKPEKKMGMIGCPTGDIILENVRVHKSDILGEVDQGFVSAMKSLDVGRIGIAAQSVGIARAAMEEAVRYSKERKQFGKSISQFQAVAFMLADMETKLSAATLLTYNAAWLRDRGRDASKDASIAKYYASEVCNEICAKAIQIHGGYGFIKDYRVERLYRDARVLTLYEGTSQVQQLVISGQVLKQYK
jgi:alkylation response protein AidB-like acyl-CoA dehydrogenase